MTRLLSGLIAGVALLAGLTLAPSPQTAPEGAGLSFFETEPRVAVREVALGPSLRSREVSAAACASWKKIGPSPAVCLRTGEFRPVTVLAESAKSITLSIDGSTVKVDRRRVLDGGSGRLVVVPGGTSPDPARGKASSHSYIFENNAAPARWNRCEPVRWAVDASQLEGTGLDSDQEISRLNDVLSLAGKSAGLKFVFAGEGSIRNAAKENAFSLDGATRALNADLLITFGRGSGSGPYAFDELASGPAGVGGVYVVSYGPEEPMRVRGGFVVLNVEALTELTGRIGRWRTPSDYVGSVYLHEVLHALNLGHVNDTSQTMNPVVVHGIARLAAGDQAGLAGMRALPCLS